MMLAAFNDLPEPLVRQELLACCAATGWAELVAAARPFDDREALRKAGDDAMEVLTWEQLRAALDAHPRIGERSAGAGREAAWSRAEQVGAETADASTAAALVRANIDYERRFGHIFLVCATGLSAGQILAAATARLGNDPVAERECVRRELAAIAGLRLDRLVSP